jgi:transcriptional regulator with XRE-family HTH domain
MREEREWSQAKAGQAIGKPQNVISRLESPAYGKITLQTLLDIANGFDVGLLIKFVPLSRLVKEYEDLSPEALSAKSVCDEKEVEKLEKWALEGLIGAATNTTIATNILTPHKNDRKLAETMKMWRSDTSEPAKISLAPSIVIGKPDDILLNMLLEGKIQNAESTSGYTRLKNTRSTEPTLGLLPIQSTVTDYTSSKFLF